MYKGKYLIGVYTYDKYEMCETILDSAHEFAEYAEINLNLAREILSMIFHHKQESVFIDGRRKKIEFILGFEE